VVWNNRLISANTPLYIDIFGVSQPRSVNITPAASYISVSIDTDTDYSNGVAQYNEVSDIQPSSAPANVIIIESTTMSPNYIRALQDITVTFSFSAAGKLTAGKKVYVVLPASYAIWVNRGTNVTVSDCVLNADGSATNLATACTYISQRVLAVTSGVHAGQKYTVTVKNVKSSPFLPQEVNNNIRFYVYLASNDELSVTDYSYEDKSSSLSLISNTNLIDLSWLSYIPTQTNSTIGMNLISSGTVYIYTGYFSRIT
jgi:hypothetical protein